MLRLIKTCLITSSDSSYLVRIGDIPLRVKAGQIGRNHPEEVLVLCLCFVLFSEKKIDEH